MNKRISVPARAVQRQAPKEGAKERVMPVDSARNSLKSTTAASHSRPHHKSPPEP
jgi:hypothetical protein